MYCEYCGKELKEGMSCDCQQAAAVQLKGEKKDMFKEKIMGMKSKKILLAGVGIGIVVIVIVASMIMSKPQEIDLGAYISEDIEVTGFDGNAMIDVDTLYNSFALETEIYNKVTSGEKLSEEELANMDEEDFSAAFSNNVSTLQTVDSCINEMHEYLTVTCYVNDKEVTKIKNLENGDKVKIVASADSHVIEAINVKLVDGEKEMTIENLEEGKELDVFGKVKEISFQGISGEANMTVEWEKNLDFPVVIDLGAENDGYLSNGETVFIEVSYDPEELMEAGFYLKEDSRKMKVEGLSEYVESPEQLSEDLKKKLIDMTVEEISTDKWAFSSADNVSFDSMYLGTSLDESGIGNCICVVASYEEDGEQYYAYETFHNIVIDQDGNHTVDGASNLGDLILLPNGGYTEKEIIDYIQGHDYYDFTELR